MGFQHFYLPKFPLSKRRIKVIEMYLLEKDAFVRYLWLLRDEEQLFSTEHIELGPGLVGLITNTSLEIHFYHLLPVLSLP